MYTLIISLLLGASFSILSFALIDYLSKFAFNKKMKERLHNLSDFNFKGLSGFMFYLADRIGENLKKFRIPLLQQMSKVIEESLEILGKPYSTIKPQTFIGIQILSGFGVFLFLLLVFEVYDILLLLIFLIMGFYLPLITVKEKVKAKHKAIFRQLPDTLDLLTLMVEAGLDFNNALNKIIESEKGELISELHLVQQEIKLGKSRDEAFKDMAKRLQYKPLSSVVSSLTNAFTLGGSLAPILKILADQFRVERTQLAEKMAGEAPLKLMFPLVLFIFPTIFIIIFGPIVLSFISSGGF
ncbi:MAG: type II secretion system F family protein [Elusimicrobia bacterium]|nr:type II secretion system F family protein [Candidatus Liberimonas magnetica]